MEAPGRNRARPARALSLERTAALEGDEREEEEKVNRGKFRDVGTGRQVTEAMLFSSKALLCFMMSILHTNNGAYTLSMSSCHARSVLFTYIQGIEHMVITTAYLDPVSWCRAIHANSTLPLHAKCSRPAKVKLASGQPVPVVALQPSLPDTDDHARRALAANNSEPSRAAALPKVTGCLSRFMPPRAARGLQTRPQIRQQRAPYILFRERLALVPSAFWSSFGAPS